MSDLEFEALLIESAGLTFGINVDEIRGVGQARKLRGEADGLVSFRHAFALSSDVAETPREDWTVSLRGAQRVTLLVERLGEVHSFAIADMRALPELMRDRLDFPCFFAVGQIDSDWVVLTSGVAAGLPGTQQP